MQQPEPKDRSMWLPAWVVDIGIMVLILIATIFPMPGGFPGIFPGGPGGGPVPHMPNQHFALIGLALAVVTMVAVPLRRRWPLPVYLLSFVAYLAAVLFEVPALGPGIGAVVAVFAVANNASRVKAWTFGAIGAVIVAVVSLFVNEHMVIEPQVFQIAAAIAIATALGDSARSRREYTRAAMERAERAEQTREAEARRRVAEERLRIAQDLHDTVAHRISVISLNAGVASSSLETKPEKAKESLATIRSAARDVLGDIGVLLRYLRADDTAGSASGSNWMVQPGIDDIDALIATVTESGLHVEHNFTGDKSLVDETTGRVAYRVAQEGLTNAHKHGSGGNAALDISVKNGNVKTVTIQVTNPVSGTSRNQPDAPSGNLGLTGLRERVGAVGGEITAEESRGTFTLIAELPLSSRTRNREETL